MQNSFTSLLAIILLSVTSLSWGHPLCSDIQEWRDQKQGMPNWLMVVNLPEQEHSSLVEFSYVKASNHSMIDYFIDSRDQHKTTVVAKRGIGNSTYSLDVFFDYYQNFQQHMLTGIEQPGVYNFATRSESVGLGFREDPDDENASTSISVSIFSGFTIHEYSFGLQTWIMQEHSPNHYKSINDIEVNPNAVFRLEYNSSVWLADGGDSYEVKYNNNRWEGVPLMYLEALDKNKDNILQHLAKKPTPLDCQLD